jgi:glutathione synthase
MNPIALFILSTENFIDPEKDTSYLLMLEAQRKGLNILVCDHREIYFTYNRESKKINIVAAKEARAVEVIEKEFVKESVLINSSWAIESGLNIKSESEYHILEDFSLASSSVIFMRSDPPVDDAYLDACSYLESIKNDVMIVNNPSALINFNEKLCTLNFPNLIPKTFILENPTKIELDKYAKKFSNGVVIKPLNLCGGEGVQRYDGERFNSVDLVEDTYIVQEFLKEVDKGDKRIIILNGEPLGAILRIAKEGSFICNFHSGGRPSPTEITKEDLYICNQIKDFLIDNHIYFAGIDIIGGKLTEINITSPTCVQEINRANNVKLEENVLDFILSKIN